MDKIEIKEYLRRAKNRYRNYKKLGGHKWGMRKAKQEIKWAKEQLGVMR